MPTRMRGRTWFVLWIVLLNALAALLPHSAAKAGTGYVTKQLTDNSHFDGYHQINANGWVVWQGSADGSTKDIFLSKGGGSPINISNNGKGFRSPQINANG